MLSGLVKNHFESSHSPLSLCKLIFSMLYETQKTFHQREGKNVALLFIPHSPSCFSELFIACRFYFESINHPLYTVHWCCYGDAKPFGLQLMIVFLKNQLMDLSVSFPVFWGTQWCLQIQAFSNIMSKTARYPMSKDKRKAANPCIWAKVIPRYLCFWMINDQNN